MERSRKFKIFLSLMFVLLIFSVGTFFFFQNSPQDDEGENVLGREDLSSVPRIISLAPMSVYEGEEYVYIVKFTDNDTDFEQVSVDILDGPNWLVLTNSKISGIAPLGSIGAYKLVVRVSDGDNSSLQESYILVEKNDE